MTEAAQQVSRLPVLVDTIRMYPFDEAAQTGLVEDTGAGKFFRLGQAEYDFVQLLWEASRDGASNGEAVESYRRAHASELPPAQQLAMLQWLQMNRLLQQTGSDAATIGAGLTKVISSCFFVQLPLGNPDWLVTQVYRLLRPLSSWTALFAICCVFLCCLASLLPQAAAFADSYANLFTAWRGGCVLTIWLLLKVIHEVAHGVTCKRYGGEVRSAGIAMILFLPIAFVDVSSAWRFASRWQRLHVTLAGLAAELAVASIAIVVWHVAESAIALQLAADTILLATVGSIAFNMNPLLRFDGYFALADLTGCDNLYSYGSGYAKYFGKRYVFGLREQLPRLRDGRKLPVWIRVYGIAAACYRVFTVVALIVAAGLLFYGAGVILAVAGTLVFFALPAARFARSLVALHRQRDLLLWKLSARLGLFVVFLLGMMFILPADFRSTVPAIVEYDPPTYVRAMSEGFVERVYVVDGEVVELGQPIVRLANEQLLLQLETSRVELASTQQEIRSARWNGQPSLLADAQLRLTSLESQIKELEKRVEGLTVRAKRGGRVLGRDLADRVGSWVRRGEELAVIGNESSKRLKLVLNQKDASSRREWSKRPLSVTVLGVPGWAGRISHFDERASRAVPADELIATNGGRLAVQRVEPGEASQPEDELFELTEPHLCGYVPLAPSHSQILQVGQRAYVRIARRHISIAEWLYRKVIAL